MNSVRIVRWFRLAQGMLAIVLGLLAPATLLYQAHEAIGGLDDQISAPVQIEKIAAAMPRATQAFKSENDYALFSLALIESNNFRALANKQGMKIGVIHIGFAIVSVGLLFIVLGIDQGGLEASGESSGMAINLKVASSGLAIFALGATLAGAGGLLPNQYSTAGIPGYAGMTTTLGNVEPALLKRETVRLCLEHTPDERNMTSCITNSLSH